MNYEIDLASWHFVHDPAVVKCVSKLPRLTTLYVIASPQGEAISLGIKDER